MSKSKIAKEIVEAVLETPSFIKTVKVDSEEQPSLSWWTRVLIFLHIRSKPAKRKVNLDLFVKPSTATTIYAVSGLLHEVNSIVSGKLSEHKAVNTIKPILIKAIATAIHNDNGEAPEWLQKVISDQFSSAELNTASQEVYRRLDYENFYNTIISLGAANMIDTQEIEAHGQPSEQ